MDDVIIGVGIAIGAQLVDKARVRDAMPLSYRGTKGGPKKTIDRSQKEGEQRIEKTANDGAGKNRRPRQKESVAARTTAPRSPTYARVTQHARVTAGRSHKRPTLGFFDPAKVIHAGNTVHFDVSYLSRLGQKGANLAQAILQTCERDYGALQAIFGGLTPGRLPFVVQITSDNSGASHSSCLGTDVMVGGNSGTSVDFIRSLLVAEVDEVFMANFGFGWDCGAKFPARVSHGSLLTICIRALYRQTLSRQMYGSTSIPDLISSIRPIRQTRITSQSAAQCYFSIGCISS